jgi:hypothetical protein
VKLTHIETILANPDNMQGELAPPAIEEGWLGGQWELVSVSMGPKKFHDDYSSPVWFTIAWRRGGMK